LRGPLVPGIIAATRKADAAPRVPSAETTDGTAFSSDLWGVAVRTASPLLLAAVLVGLTAWPARAGLIGTQVSGSAQLNFVPINVFDPANGSVPPGYLNDAGTTVTIAEPAIEFGAQNSTNLITANFAGTQLIVTDVAVAPFGGTSFLMSFTDPAFTGLSVSTISDNYTNGILSQLTGDTLVVIWSGTVVSQPTTFQAVFDITPSAVPEPTSSVLAGTVGLAGLVAWARRRRRSSRRP
jgi:PEP-CTERM motif